MAGARRRGRALWNARSKRWIGTPAAYRLDHDYGFFGPLPRGAGMKRTDYFRRQQNPHKDPGLNALVAGLARNDTTGCRRAMLRETRTAKQFKGGSDPGLCGT
jgi:hypothetical protein